MQTNDRHSRLARESKTTKHYGLYSPRSPGMTLIIGALIILCGNSSAYAEDTAVTVPASQAQMKMSFAPLVKRAAPAVVNIYTKSKIAVQEQSPFMNDPFFQQFFGRNAPGNFGGRQREQVVSSLGSGVIIKPEGIIVTSLHVVKDAQEISVVLSDNREFSATVMIKDPRADLAFLQIKAPERLPYIELRDSDTLEVGELVLAIGNPFGVGQTVTNGIVSALARRAEGVSDYNFFIQTDAAINPGNSGGALIGMDGKLIGINTAIYSRSGGSMGIGFAIPANMVASLLDSKAQNGQVVRAWLGLSVQPVTAEIADSLGMKAPKGVLAKSIFPGSPADKAGIRTGDVVLSLNGTPLNNEQDLQYRLALSKIGNAGEMEILREGKPLKLDVTFGQPPENPARDVRTLKGRQPLSGVIVANLSPALALEMQLPDASTGVVITGAVANGEGMNLGLARGDIILQVNGTKITSTQVLEKVMTTATKTWQIVYLRAGNAMTLTIRLPG